MRNGERVLFFDDRYVEEMKELTRVMHPAVKHEGNPVLKADKPWEVSDRKAGIGIVHVYGTVRKEGDLFKIWYQVYPRSGKLYWVCYATSKDGLHWEKPALDLFEYNRLKRGEFTEEEVKGNNIVLINCGRPGATMACSPAISVDPDEPDPNRRYKMLFWDFGVRYYEPGQYMGGCVAFSPDGIHWTPYPGNPVLTASDVTDATWDPVERRYIAHFKLYQLLTEAADPTKPVEMEKPAEFFLVGRKKPTQEKDTILAEAYFLDTTLQQATLETRALRNCRRISDRRIVARAESKDFINWTNYRAAIIPDRLDAANQQTYGMSAFRYESIYVGLLRIMTGQSIDIQLAYSNDGADWQRCFDRTSFIPCGAAGGWDAGMVLTASEPVLVGEELWFYYGGWSKQHHEWGETSIGIAKLRRDGFVSLDAGEKEGELLTRPVTLAGPRLKVNANAGRGSLAAELLDESGRTIPGYGRKDCKAVTADTTNGEITWTGNRNLSALAGRKVRVRFFLKSAHLYSFWLEGGK